MQNYNFEIFLQETNEVMEVIRTFFSWKECPW